MDIESLSKKLLLTKNFGQKEVFLLQSFLDYYFKNNRPRSFKKFEKPLRETIFNFINVMSFNDLLTVIPNFYLFCYTVHSDISDQRQKLISKFVFQPFAERIRELIQNKNIDPLNFSPKGNKYLIICRHAVTQGRYASGKQIYTIVDALLESKNDVTLIVHGNIDEMFSELNYSNNNLELINMSLGIDAFKDFLHLRKLCAKLRPYKIITEIEIGLATCLYYSGIKSKILYWSPGFYRFPWYDIKLLVPEIYEIDISNISDLIEIPHSLNYKLLAPPVKKEQIQTIRENNLGLKCNDFLIGTFSRYEKISEEFLRFVLEILSNNPEIKFVLAGPNDQSFAKSILKDAIYRKQAILLGLSNVHLLGNSCDIFLDTFPTPCGYSALEMIAKGKPVLGIKGKHHNNFIKVRLPELIYKTKEELEKTLLKLKSDKEFYNQIANKQKQITSRLDKSKELASFLMKI